MKRRADPRCGTKEGRLWEGLFADMSQGNLKTVGVYRMKQALQEACQGSDRATAEEEHS